MIKKFKEVFYFIGNRKQNYIFWKKVKMRILYLKMYVIQIFNFDYDRVVGIVVNNYEIG